MTTKNKKLSVQKLLITHKVAPIYVSPTNDEEKI